ncbi:hypothetical protein B0T22DRAFT_531791 [Podospora appendiculata]|uniref:Uncharacterized protein n=1 Tax=Podospora appendiculata TaxID=314037 RepID=A0AAE1CF71_9PEZI|nr:hypothetical protein B0T22DRAFT_531791 [Podospora appendiculata]
MDRNKVVHRLETPFSTVEWPQISQDDQDLILSLLCSLLAPLGSHRKSNNPSSKGRRKRSRNGALLEAAGEAPALPAVPVPELAAFVDVGLANISRNLQARSSKTGGPDSVPEEGDGAPKSAKAAAEAAKPPYSIVFVARSGQSSAFHSHFPQMVAVASESLPSDKGIMLVGFSKPCEERLSAALGIPRVSSIALREGAPHSKGLVDFVRANVSPIDVAWIKEARAGGFLETQIEAVKTAVGSKKATTGSNKNAAARSNKKAKHS